MSTGNSPLQHHAACTDPLMLGPNGKIISRAEFARRCHIATPYKDKVIRLQDSSTRARNLYFGFDKETLRWKYRFRMCVEKGKRELIQRAYDAIVLNCIGQGDQRRHPHHEEFNFNYNQKISLYI